MKEAMIESVTVSPEHFCAMCDDGDLAGLAAGLAAKENGKEGAKDAQS